MKILHISDLHFCADGLSHRLDEFVRAAQELVSGEFEMHRADEGVIAALTNLVHSEDPDVLVITGDITTFGDAASFGIAKRWLYPLLQRPNGRGSRTVVATPGNHDALPWHLSAALWKLESCPWYFRAATGVYLRRSLNALGALWKEVGGRPQQDPAAMLAAFNDFASSLGLTQTGGHSLDLPAGAKVQVFPFCTVSLVPLWSNIGKVRTYEVARLRQSLADATQRGDRLLRIVALHHNPISSPYVAESSLVHAYNSMPEGTRFLRVMQENRVDLVLHGHQHEDYVLRYDFEVAGSGHVFAVGCKASGIASNAGANLFVVEDHNHLVLRRLTHDPGHGAFVDAGDNATGGVELCLEHKRPRDAMTRTTRAEIKRYLIPQSQEDDREEEGLWDDVQKEGSSLVYMVGRSMSEITEKRFAPILSMLRGSSGTRVRVLLSNPRLLRTLSLRLRGAQPADVWGSEGFAPRRFPAGPLEQMLLGQHETLDALAERAELTFRKLDGIIESALNEEQKRRLNVRVAHTILPFAATVRDADTAFSSMVLRLLPQGAMKAFESPLLRLNRRKDRALFDYYAKHLRYLLARGATVLGEWDGGTDDLSIDGLEAPNE